MAIQTFKTLADAVALAEFAHRNQTDKAGFPYVKHPLRVLEKVQAQGAAPYVQMAAVLHDVSEDTAFTVDILTRLGFSEAVTNIVRLLDRDASRKEFHHLNPDFDGAWYTDSRIDEFYYKNIAKHPGAKMVKLADIDDNLEPWRQSYLSDETQARLLKKYSKARELLGH